MFQHLQIFQTKAIYNTFQKGDTEATMASDYLCLKLGHNDMSKTLADYLKTKFNYELDVVSSKYTLFTK